MKGHRQSRHFAYAKTQTSTARSLSNSNLLGYWASEVHQAFALLNRRVEAIRPGYLPINGNRARLHGIEIALAVMQVVHAAPEDARAVAEIHVNTWRAAYATFLPSDYLESLSIEDREAMWSKCIASGVPELLVAKEAGAVQGWLSFGQCRDEGSSKTEAEIWAIYVAPSAWSIGTGRLLWLRARDLMLVRGFKSCSLWVFPQNDRAIKFYRSAGFVRDGSEPISFELGGTKLQEVRFVSRLEG